MKLTELRNIQKPYFGFEEISRILGITGSSAKVSAARYVKQGLLLRVKKNMYVLRETWDKAGPEEKFVLANMGQSPSYISLMTALDYYDITSQAQRNVVESVAVTRTKEICVNSDIFRYTKLREDLYSGFIKRNDFFIAVPEKALVDAFYLMSYGRYALDLSALDREKLDGDQIEAFSGKFPLRTRAFLKTHGYPSST